MNGLGKFFICQKPQEALQGKFFQKKKFKTAASKINCQISFHGQKKIKIQFIDTEKSANTETLHCPRGSVGMCFILAYIRVPSVALTAQMWAGRISCSKAQSGAYKSLCIHKTLSFIHSFIHFFFLKLEFDPAYFW